MLRIKAESNWNHKRHFMENDGHLVGMGLVSLQILHLCGFARIFLFVGAIL